VTTIEQQGLASLIDLVDSRSTHRSEEK